MPVCHTKDFGAGILPLVGFLDFLDYYSETKSIKKQIGDQLLSEQGLLW